VRFSFKSEYEPRRGDQPTAIKEWFRRHFRCQDPRTQVFARRHGSGQEPTPWAKVTRPTQRPAIIMAPNKTLAAQALWRVSKSFFPDNAVNISYSSDDNYQRGPMFAEANLYREGTPPSTSRADPQCATRRTAGACWSADDVSSWIRCRASTVSGSVECGKTYTAMTFALTDGPEAQRSGH